MASGKSRHTVVQTNKGADNQNDRQANRQTDMEMTDNRVIVFVTIIVMSCYVYINYFS